MTRIAAPRTDLLSGRNLSSEEAAVFETSIVPRYLSLFAEPLVTMLAASPDARVCHLACRTGYPDAALLDKLPDAHVHGCDGSEPAIELARTKAAALVRAHPGSVFDYRVHDAFPLPFPSGVFSHALALHPLAATRDRRGLLVELARLVAPHGQGVISLPLRGSFGEVIDLLLEYALKFEVPELATAVEAAAQLRPTNDLIGRELAASGFEYVDVEVRHHTLRFPSGRELFDDPIVRLVLMPEFRASVPFGSLGQAVEPFAYVRDAIDKYWSDGTFAMTVTVGVASGRRRAA